MFQLNIKERIQAVKDARFKIGFYVMSLGLLFFLVFVVTVDIPISLDPKAKFIGFKELFDRNWIAFSAIVGMVISYRVAKYFKRRCRGGMEHPRTIVKIHHENYEYLTFLTTYIIPLVCIDFDKKRNVLMLAVLLVIIGFLFIRLDLYYGNPTLGLAGYRLYRAEIEDVNAPDGVILISRDRLSDGDSINWIKLDDYVWVAKEVE